MKSQNLKQYDIWYMFFFHVSILTYDSQSLRLMFQENLWATQDVQRMIFAFIYINSCARSSWELQYPTRDMTMKSPSYDRGTVFIKEDLEKKIENIFLQHARDLHCPYIVNDSIKLILSRLLLVKLAIVTVLSDSLTQKDVFLAHPGGGGVQYYKRKAFKFFTKT